MVPFWWIGATLVIAMETNNSLAGNFSLLCVLETDRERSDDSDQVF